VLAQKKSPPHPGLVQLKLDDGVCLPLLFGPMIAVSSLPKVTISHVRGRQVPFQHSVLNAALTHSAASSDVTRLLQLRCERLRVVAPPDAVTFLRRVAGSTHGRAAALRFWECGAVRMPPHPISHGRFKSSWRG
jgi:hypothetical protein